MAFNQQHMVLQWQGAVREFNGGPALEIFTGSMRFAGPALSSANNQNTATSMAVVLADYWGKADALIPTSHQLDVVKWNLVGTDGRYVSETGSQETVVPGVPGGVTSKYPLQVAWVTTWETDAVRGKANRGRTYWPTAAPVQANFYVNQSVCGAKSKVDNQLIRDLNAAARSGYVAPRDGGFPSWATSIGWAPGNASEGSGMTAQVMSRAGNGTSRVITRATVGNRLDVQRRRANGQIDQRYFVAAS